jgi:predicted ATPase
MDRNGGIAIPKQFKWSGATGLDACQFLDSNSFRGPEAIKDRVSEATRLGWLDRVIDKAKNVVLGLTDLRLVDLDGQSVAFLYFGKGQPSIPVHAAGEGMQRIVEMALAVMGGPPGLVVLEEPENFLHAAAQHVCSEILWAAVDKGEQVLLSTHNLELLDKLLTDETGSPRDLSKVAVFKTSLESGEFGATCFEGSEALEARNILGQDLRI